MRRASRRTGAAGWIGVCLCWALASGGCGEKAPPPAASGPAPVAKPTVTGSTVTFPAGAAQLASLKSKAVVAREARTVEMTARLVWDENRTVRVFPPFAGRVVRIAGQVGESVRAGQVLATLASPDLGQAQADAGRARADLALAEKNLARVRELHDNGVAPRKDLVQAEAELARAQAEMQRADSRARLYGAGSAVDQTLALKSPLAGVIVERNINPGQELRPDQGGMPALFVVTDPARLWVQVDVHEQDLSVLAKGAAFRLRVATYPDISFPARVEAIGDFVDPQTRVVRARGAVDNVDRRLKGEMLATAVFEASQPGGVEVPARAVLFTEGSYFAFVDRGGGAFERVQVVPGAERAGKIAVLRGLDVGQQVVADGAILLQQLLRTGSAKTESE
ncbi:MAG: efflux RND transporter periplasmic adaptor subunit [Burkholderiales bacterium]|nr:efflux RND transporter periplasmic adaptor subunit [Burkholderiales bacterium]